MVRSRWRIVYSPYRLNLGPLSPGLDGGIIKYDLRMSTVIANMKKIIAIKGVVAELVIMDRIEKHGCPKGALDVLVDLKRLIQASYDDEGISQELSTLKIRYRPGTVALREIRKY